MRAPDVRRGLLTLLRNLKKDEKELRILMLGLDNSGKTTALRKLADVRARARLTRADHRRLHPPQALCRAFALALARARCVPLAVAALQAEVFASDALLA